MKGGVNMPDTVATVFVFILDQIKSLVTTIMGDATLSFPVVVGMVGSIIGLTFSLLGRRRSRRRG